MCYDKNWKENVKYNSTTGGTCRNGLEAFAPTVMWVEALDILLSRLVEKGFTFSRVKALSGCGQVSLFFQCENVASVILIGSTDQQHGSVYWKRGAEEILRNLDPAKALNEQLRGAFAFDQSPVWQDSRFVYKVACLASKGNDSTRS